MGADRSYLWHLNVRRNEARYEEIMEKLEDDQRPPTTIEGVHKRFLERKRKADRAKRLRGYKDGGKGRP